MPAAGPAIRSNAYPIRAVARLTGVSIDTLRAWERRYQAIVPERGERGRIYRDTHLARLKRLARLVQSGHAIGTIAQLTDQQLARLAATTHATATENPVPPVRLDELMLALDHFDLTALDAELSRFSAVLPPEALIHGVVLPLLRELGRRWAAASLTPAQEHLVSAIVRTVLGGLLRTAAPGGKPTVIFATVEGERHELGLLAGAVLCARAGFKVMYLGADLPVDDIAAAANDAKAAAIVVSFTVVDARASLTRLRKRAPRPTVFVGGPKAGVAGREPAGVQHVDDLPALLPRLEAGVE